MPDCPTCGFSINADRLWASLMELARIGATPAGGNARLALTALDGQGRDLLVRWMREAGLQVRVDAVGNIFGVRPGRSGSDAPVATGSHIDTQPTGGKFDGCYGVLAGLEVMRCLQERGIETEAPLALVIWTNEEGSRFVPVMMGSGVHCGVFPLETALAATDLAGLSVRDELQAIGYGGGEPIGSVQPRCYIEAHIEQGPVLEAGRQVVGVVTGSLGLRWYDVVVQGQEAHAGPTPMPLRRDALRGAARLIDQVLAIGHDPAFAPHGRATVGQVQVHPNSRNVIPGRVHFTVDLRHQETPVLDVMEQRLRALVDRPDAGLTVQLHEVQAFAPTPFDPALVARVRAHAAARGHAHQDIVTGAGHDAVYMARVVPTAMIFVPCKDGISHNEAEDADPAHLAAGADVLLDTLLQQAGVAGRQRP
ncbi:Zn-dependent hydrolase [uncultured Aquincola sp.]|uniref:Zn-dependent hydrolase n=1 Tax=uncultured Aquincola sp. TaxID=886556 RepID=UPI0032B124B1